MVIASAAVCLSVLVTAVVVVRDILWQAPPLGDRPNVDQLERLDVEDSTTADFLLDEVRNQLQRRTAVSTSVDAQISQFLTIIGGGTGVAALFFRKDPIIHPTALLGAAGITLLMVLVNCVMSVVPRRRQARDVRDIEDYNTTSFLKDPSNKAKLAHELVIRYASISNAIRISIVKKRRYFLAAAALFVLAIALILGQVWCNC